MKVKLSLIVLLVLPNILYGQQYVNGRVLDEITSEPIPSVHITDSIFNIGTITNEEGFFTIKVSKASELILTHINYTSAKIRVDHQPELLIIKLKPSTRILPEVTISGNMAEKIVMQALSKAKQNSKNEIFARAFFRQLTKHDSLYTELKEVFYLARLSNRRIEANMIEQGRYAVKDGTFFRYQNFSYLLNAMPAYINEIRGLVIPISPFVSDYYDLEIIQFHNNGEDELVEINCRRKEGVTKPIITGSLFINSKTYDILALKGNMENCEDFWQYSKEKYKAENMKYEIDMVLKKKDSIYYPDYISITLNHDLKIYGGKTKKVSTRAILFFFEYTDTPKNKMSDINVRDKDIDLIKKAKYNPQFRLENPII